MKRLALALTILTGGAAGFCALRNASQQSQESLAIQRAALAAQTQAINQARSLREDLMVRIRGLNSAPPSVGTGAGAATSPPLGKTGSEELDANRLLAELGFDWNTSDQYIFVSKETLRAVRIEAMHKDRVTPAVADVLALSPGESETINAAAAQAADLFRSWATAHVERQEPHGDVVAQYTLPVDAAFSQSLSNSFVGQVSSILGPERTGFFLEYAVSWMTDLGISGSEPMTLVVKRYGQDGEPHLGYEVRRSGGSMSSEVAPHQPMPRAFKMIFPNGWPDLAKAEGFALPASYFKR